MVEAKAVSRARAVAAGPPDIISEMMSATHAIGKSNPLEDGAPSALSKEPARESARDRHHVFIRPSCGPGDTSAPGRDSTIVLIALWNSRCRSR